MKNSLRNCLFILILLAAITFVHGAVPGDLNGDKIVSQDELLNAENLLKEGKITSDQLEEIEHIKENYPRTIVDCTNRTVSIYKPINRIIAFGGYDTEIISMLGEEDKIVGSPNYLKDIDFRRVFFPSLIKKTAPGSASSPDYEMILNLSPDLITCWHYYPSKLEEQLPGNITVVGLDLFDPKTFIEEARKLAYLLEKEGDLNNYIDGFYSKYMDLIRDRTKGLPEEKIPKVYWERQKPYESFGGPNYITRVIELAGGRNIFADDNFDISVIDSEKVITINPDIIIRYASSKGPETGYAIDDPAQAMALRDSVMQRPELAETNAVKNGRVYVLYMALPLGIQGPIGEIYAAKIMQPDLFKELDPQKIIQEFLSDYLGAEFDASKHGVFVYPPV
ncbi:MAG: ABC transporter substrate-binding protein [Methanothrix sp.]